VRRKRRDAAGEEAADGAAREVRARRGAGQGAVSGAPDEEAAQRPTATRAILGLDRLVHEPARLAILTVLAEADEVEFRFLEGVTGLTKGNISSHVSKLEAAGYVTVRKWFKGRVPTTSYSITPAGRAALESYRAALKALVGG